MAQMNNIIKSPIQGKLGTLNRSSGYQYRDFWYKNSSGQNVHVVGWHRAVDITTLGTVVAFARGKVIGIVKGITGQTTNPSGGNSVTLEHANGCRTTYCHLDNGSNNHLKIGDIVNEGDKLGTDVIKTTGNSTGLHLHFAIYNPNETYQDSHYMNPIDYMQGTKKLIGYGETSLNQSSPNSDINNKSVDELAKEVIAGKYGNGDARKNALGSRYSEVQAKVNELLSGNQKPSEPAQPSTPSVDILTLVKKTIRGDFGNGQARRNALGSNYDEVQRQVNLNIQHGTTRWDNIKLY